MIKSAEDEVGQLQNGLVGEGEGNLFHFKIKRT